MTIDLKAIRAAAEAAIKKYGGYPVTDPAFVIALMDRLEAAEKDATRYRWVRYQDGFTLDRLIAASETVLRVDAAIDAAMKGMK